jgi:DNA polymerase
MRDWDAAREALDAGAEVVDMAYGPPLDVISRMLRGAIYAPEGKELAFADLAQIEARGVAWIAGQDDLVELFATGSDVYCAMATDIFGRPITKKDEQERWLGKSIVLGCGYQMSWRRFIAQCAANGVAIESDLAERAVWTYRTRFDRIPTLWRTMEYCAIEAVRKPGAVIFLDSTERIAFQCAGGWLRMRLPSGRSIKYRNPSIERDIETGRDKLTYWGVNSFTKKWGQQTTYGGRLTENAVQGFCRDIVAEAMLRLEDHGYDPLLLVHDEIISECDAGAGDIAQYIDLITRRPSWATDFPIAAEGKIRRRYAK